MSKPHAKPSNDRKRKADYAEYKGKVNGMRDDAESVATGVFAFVSNMEHLLDESRQGMLNAQNAVNQHERLGDDYRRQIKTHTLMGDSMVDTFTSIVGDREGGMTASFKSVRARCSRPGHDLSPSQETAFESVLEAQPFIDFDDIKANMAVDDPDFAPGAVQRAAKKDPPSGVSCLIEEMQKRVTPAGVAYWDQIKTATGAHRAAIRAHYHATHGVYPSERELHTIILGAALQALEDPTGTFRG